jgi:taurine dioxygenase
MDNAASSFTPLSPVIGMEVRGVDLARPMSPETVERLTDELSRHSILLFRDQELSPEQHIACSRFFGELEPHVANQFNLPAHPEIFVVSNVVENGREIGARGGARHWHSDYSYRELPSLGSLFYCLEAPPEGGQTQFASMYAAYERLSKERQKFLEGARAVHDYNHYWTTYTSHRPPLTEKQKAQVPPVAHPALRTHPVSGRSALYLCQHVVSHFEGMGYDESQKIVEEVVDAATDERFVYTHEWRVGDVLFWDNRSSMHRVMPFDEEAHRRRMHRTTITGDRPFYAPARNAA